MAGSATTSVRKMPETPPVRAQLAYERMLQAIQLGQLTSGTRVREADVAAWLQVSRTPVREAMRRLEAEGMLSHIAHVGVVVTEIDAEMVTELYAMREVLEGTAAGLSYDPAVLMRHNREFHDIIYRSAHNRYLLKSLNALRDSLSLLGATTLGSKTRAAAAQAEHAAIVKAITARDPPAAERLMRGHIRGAYHERLNLLFKNGGR